MIIKLKQPRYLFIIPLNQYQTYPFNATPAIDFSFVFNVRWCKKSKIKALIEINVYVQKYTRMTRDTTFMIILC